MSEKMEKLMLSVAIYFQAYREECRFDPTIPDRSMDYAKKVITRIGKAYADGELELPGEVGRYQLLPPRNRTYSEWALDMHIEESANDFIALRKEEEK